MLKRHILIPATWIAVLLFWALPVWAEMIVDTAWVRRYNGPQNYDDRAYSIAVDGSGNVYVTGWSGPSWFNGDYATIKYHPDGDTAWVRRYDGGGDDLGRAIAVDRYGNVYVTGYIGSDYGTLKYDPNGNVLWVKTDSYGEWGEAQAMAVDSNGNVYVTGVSFGEDTGEDYTTIKYRPNGDTAWVRRYHYAYEFAEAIAVDGSGNVYVTGGSSGDYATVKYDSSGNQVWVKRYHGPSPEGGVAFSVAVDDFGNVYVTGVSTGDGTWEDYATVKYDQDGTELWARRYNGPVNGEDWGIAVAIDDSANVYVTGYSYGSGTDHDYATIKYDGEGNELWVKRFDGPVSGSDQAMAMAVDGSGNVYVTGGSSRNGTVYDYATVKYNPGGAELWVERYNGLEEGYGGAYAIAVDDSENVYVTGTSCGTGTGADYATIKYVQFLCGDANGDGQVNLADAVYIVNYLFIGGPEPLEAGDANCDGEVDLADAVYLVNYLFIGGPPPCE
jgi:hypothetical protein